MLGYAATAFQEEPPMGMATTGTHRSHINVTPLIDVLLVLLIIFMVIQPATVHGLNALAPHPPAAPDAAQDSRTVLVRLSKGPDGRLLYWVNGEPANLASVNTTLADLSATRDDRTIFVRADAALDYQPVLELINAAHAAGFQNIGLITQQLLIRQ